VNDETVAAVTGDDLLPAANMVFNRRATLDGTPEQIWPWLVQLGKRRAGWYLPSRLDRLLPAPRRALRTLDPRFQHLAVGERIPDYGGRDEWLEVVRLAPPHAIVFRSVRRGRPFTWALLLTPTGDGHTELRLRFRGQIRSRGLRRRLVLGGGGFFDSVTGQLMIAGLRERLMTSHRADRDEQCRQAHRGA
jgi:hypothetical protein